MKDKGGLRGHGELPLAADINVTSLVDVAFVLLIIFIITAPIMQGGVDVRLPRADAQALEPRQGLIVSVDAQGGVHVDEQQWTYDEFRAAFPALVETRDPEGVFLRGDTNASYGAVVRVLALIRSAGVEDVGLVVEEERR